LFRVVFDTNVLVSRLLAPKESAATQAVRQVMEQGGLPLFSDATFAELANVLNRSKFDAYLSREKRQYFLSEIRELSEFIPIIREIVLCRDPADNKFLEVAVCGSATHLITGDQDLQVLQIIEGIPILSPAVFLGLT
jgi:uncharacterized protein